MSLARSSSSTLAIFALRSTLRLPPFRSISTTSTLSQLINAPTPSSGQSSPSHSSDPNDDFSEDISPLPSFDAIPISRETLHRLHRLSALNPPPPDSQEEKELMGELSELVGLMELVKSVELPSSADERGDLLAQGVGEVVIGAEETQMTDQPKVGAAKKQVALTDDAKSGRELLGWATNRVGDYYASRAKTK